MEKINQTTLEILKEISTIKCVCQINIYDIDNEMWGVDTAIELVFTTNSEPLVIDVIGELLRLHNFSEEEITTQNIKDVVEHYINYTSDYEGEKDYE